MSVRTGDTVARNGEALGVVEAVHGHLALVRTGDGVPRAFFLYEIEKAGT